MKERDIILQVRSAPYEIKRLAIKDKNKGLLPSVTVKVIYVKEECPPKGIEGIEWFLMTNGEVESLEAACEMVGYYIQRWKIERFHYVLKSGCKIEKLQEREIGRMKGLILMYSVIAVFIMNLIYIARVQPELPSTILFEEEEWKTLY
ncbi:MAG: hypothetical protein LBB98_05110 [Treponema sp.]|nr:hypothetical protein [Treponema sp.]